MTLRPGQMAGIAVDVSARGTAEILPPIPVPAALPMLAVGLAGLGWVARRRS